LLGTRSWEPWYKRVQTGEEVLWLRTKESESQPFAYVIGKKIDPRGLEIEKREGGSILGSRRGSYSHNYEGGM